MKAVGLIVLGLVIGLVLAVSFNQQSGSEQESLARVSGDSSDGVNDLRAYVDQQMAAIDNRLSELASAVDDLSERQANDLSAETPTGGPGPRPAGRSPAAVSDPRMLQQIRERQQQEAQERMLAAGLTQDRMDWLDRRVEELQMEARRAQAEAGGNIDVDPVQWMLAVAEPHSLLRPEIGDEEYERYLQANGYRTTVEISRVLASSPAERGGLTEGDEIVSYDGERVFSFLELSSRAANRSSGESVVVEIKRDGRSMLMLVPGGDIGIDSSYAPIGPTLPNRVF